MTQAIIAIDPVHGLPDWTCKQSNLASRISYDLYFFVCGTIRLSEEQYAYCCLLLFYLLLTRMVHFFHQKDEPGRFNYYYVVGFSAFIITTNVCHRMNWECSLITELRFRLYPMEDRPSTMLIALALVP
jgi:hypothetical protein